MSSRPSFSCTPCRNRKVRCDRKRNCGNCQRRGEVCLWPELSLPLVDKSEGDDTLRDRVTRLEAVIAAAGLEHVAAAKAPPSHPTGPTTTNDDDDDVAIDALLEPRRNDVTHHDDFDHQIISTKKRKVDEGGLHANGAPQPANVGQDILLALPSRARCDHLVEVYFDRVEWIHHVIHRPSFDKWYATFWTRGLGYIRSSQEMHPVALLFSMLCLALHFDDKLATPDWAGESRFFDASVKALQQGDYLRRHSVAVLQTLIMQGLWLNDQGMSSMHHANLGLAIRIANLMGFSRLDAQTNGMGPTLEQEETSFTERETKRRIYWSLFCQDCYNASSCNFTYLIQSSQIKVDVFANLDDDELVRADQTLSRIEQQCLCGERGLSSLPGKSTSSSYHIAKIAFAETARRFADLYNANDLGYQSILALEKETCRCYEALPEYFQHNYAANLGPQMRWQQLFMAITFHNRIMRLHRPFLTRGYTDAEYRHSVTATVSSAKALLRLAAEGKPMSFPGLRWWVVLIHIFTAGVALCIDLHYHLSSTGNTTSMEEGEDKERWICRAIASLSDVRQFSEAANRAVEILETLYSQLREKKAQQILHQTSPPVRHADEAPDWTQLFEQALSDAQADYTTDQGILETINTFAFGVWPS